jgi:hypothetical protein
LGVSRALDELGPECFIHIDPYVLQEPNAAGLSYLDVVMAAAARGIPALAWYGYFTGEEREVLVEGIRRQASRCGLLGSNSPLHAVELSLGIMEWDRIVVNPGIVGCGVLTCNFGIAMQAHIEALAEGVRRIYADAVFEGQPAWLHRSLPLTAG